ncbi:MAG: hypothetical protein CL693_08330 [Cellvibrionaceae bacterium]|nr:hypothetical protein [Cellvibrionaceae bacterium]|tara:strand:- start:55483 stop:55737 length:255 start_codon:yes stop_codon:yes gene_type:complete
MALRTDYPYDEALSDIENLFRRTVKDEASRKDLLNYIEKCKKQKTVTFRHIHEKYVKYTNDYKDYPTLSSKDKEMIDDLFHFWG